jgi:hypothetical protein
VLSPVRPAAACLLLCSLAGCAKPERPAPQQLAYCSKLHQLYFSYHPVITYAHNGQRAQAELALQACTEGNYAAGIGTLTALLSRDRVAVPPPPPSGSGM